MSDRVSEAPALDVRRLIDDQPIGGFQWLAAILCGLIVFVDGFDAQAMGYVTPALTAEFDVARSVIGSVTSAGLFGMMLGAFALGTAADRIGRKPILVLSTLTFAIGSLLTAGADTIAQLTVLRFITGLGMGGAMPNAIALTSEYMPARHRATAVTAMICGFSLGAAAGGFVAAALIPRFGWPSVFLVGGVAPLVIAGLAAALLPESIRFLLLRGRTEQGRRAVRRLAPSVPADAVFTTGSDEAPPDRSVVAQLFTDGRAPVTLLIWVIYFMNLLDLYFLNSWLPTIMSDSGIPVSSAIRITALFQVGGVAGAIALGRVLDRRRSFLVLAACFLWAAMWIVVTAESGSSVPLLIAAMLATGIGVVGGQNASHALSSEFYPTAMRATGVGWALGIGRIGSIVGPLVGGFLLQQAGSARQVLWAASVPALIACGAATMIGVRHLWSRDA